MLLFRRHQDCLRSCLVGAVILSPLPCLQRTVTDKLQTRVESLLEERNKLQSVVKDLRVSNAF